MKSLFALATLWIVLGLSPGANAAEPINDITTADAIAIHEVVSTQLNALADDDAASAFEQTTPSKRMQIGSADDFLQMIKEEYTPMYRPQGVIFSAPEVVYGNAIQVVRLTDVNSHVWVAIFWMQQEEDSSWKIDGCNLLETSSVSI